MTPTYTVSLLLRSFSHFFPCNEHRLCGRDVTVWPLLLYHLFETVAGLQAIAHPIPTMLDAIYADEEAYERRARTHVDIAWYLELYQEQSREPRTERPCALRPADKVCSSHVKARHDATEM